MGAPSDGGINVADGSPGAPASNSVFDTTVSRYRRGMGLFGPARRGWLLALVGRLCRGERAAKLGFRGSALSQAGRSRCRCAVNRHDVQLPSAAQGADGAQQATQNSTPHRDVEGLRRQAAVRTRRSRSAAHLPQRDARRRPRQSRLRIAEDDRGTFSNS